MSSTATKPLFPSPTPGSPSTAKIPLRILLIGSLLGLTLLPLLVRHGAKLWARPHYQFFPFIVVGAALLAIRNTRDLGTLTPGRRALQKRGWIATLVVLTAAMVLGSGWLGMLCVLFLLGTLAYTLGGRACFLRCLPAGILLALVVSLPFSLDALLIAHLQKWVVVNSSQVLDLLDVHHVRLGNTLLVAGRELLVDEACTGIQSFFSLLAASLFLVFWARRGVLWAVLVVLSAPGWVFAGNVARVVLVAWCAARWQLDLVEGWRHEVLGWAIFVVELGLLWSTDQLFYFLTSPHVRWKRRNPMAPRPVAAPEVPSLGPTRLPQLQRTLLTARPLLATVVVLFALQLLLVGPGLVASLLDREDSRRLTQLGSDSLPAEWHAWHRAGFDTQERSAGHQLGSTSQSWYYRRGPQHAVVSLDYPFEGWHELPACYEGLGWTSSQRQVARFPAPQGETGASYVEVRLQKPHGLNGYLYFAELDASGREVEPEPNAQIYSLLYLLFRRLGRLELTLRPVRAPRVYQVQLLVETYHPLSDADQEQARALLDQARRTLRTAIVPTEENQP